MIRLTAQQHGGARRQAKKEETRYLKYRVCKIVKTDAKEVKALVSTGGKQNIISEEDEEDDEEDDEVDDEEDEK